MRRHSPAMLGRFVASAIVALLLGALIVGTPWLLVVGVGWPLQDYWPTWPDIEVWLTHPPSATTGLLVNTAALVAWPAWTLLALNVIATLVDGLICVLRHRHARDRSRLLRSAAVAGLVGFVLAGLLLTSLRPGTSRHTTMTGPVPQRPTIVATAAATDPRPPDAVLPGIGPFSCSVSPAPASARPAAHRSTASSPADDERSGVGQGVRPVYVVEDGDNLWDIAQAKLGDPWRWREIYVLSRGVPQPDGGVLDDPDLIQPGWQLFLPATNPAVPLPAPHQPPSSTPNTPDAPQASPTPNRPAVPAPPPQTPSSVPSPAPSAPAAKSPASSSPAGPPAVGTRARPDGGLLGLSTGGWVTAGFAAVLAGAIGLAGLHRRRHRRGAQALRFDHDLEHDLEAESWPALATNLLQARRTGRLTRLRADGLGGALLDVVIPFLDTAQGPVGAEHATAGGLGLTGPGTHGAARAVCCAALAAGGPARDAARAQVLIPAPDLALLTGLSEPGRLGGLLALPRLTVTNTLDHALNILEEEQVRRQRALDAHQLDPLTGLHETELPEIDPHDADLHDVSSSEPPLRPYLLIATAPPDPGRLSAILDSGRHQHLGALLLGTWPGAAITVGRDGLAHQPTGRAGHWLTPPARVSVLTTDECRQALDVVAEAADLGHPTTPPRLPPAPHGTDQPALRTVAPIPSTATGQAVPQPEPPPHHAATEPVIQTPQPPAHRRAPQDRPPDPIPTPEADVSRDTPPVPEAVEPTSHRSSPSADRASTSDTDPAQDNQPA